MNLFNKLKKSNLSWILELKQLFPTIKEFFNSEGDSLNDINSVYLYTYDAPIYPTAKIIDDIMKHDVDYAIKRTYIQLPSTSANAFRKYSVSRVMHSANKKYSIEVENQASVAIATIAGGGIVSDNEYIGVSSGPIKLAFHYQTGEPYSSNISAGVTTIHTIEDIYTLGNKLEEYFSKHNIN